MVLEPSGQAVPQGGHVLRLQDAGLGVQLRQALRVRLAEGVLARQDGAHLEEERWGGVG